MKNVFLLIPEIFLSLMAFKILGWEVFFPKRRSWWLPVGIFFLCALLAYLISFFVVGGYPWISQIGVRPLPLKGSWIQYEHVFGMVAIDSVSVFFKILIVSSVLLVLWISKGYREFKDIQWGTYVALLFLSTVGMMLLVGAMDLLVAVIALEIISLSSFVLTGFVFDRKSSAEGALKYFLVGSLSTALLLFGVSYYYGYFGTTALHPFLEWTAGTSHPDPVLSLIVVFLVAGLGFKLALVPFHMWAPDAYEGAPTPITAFLSSAPKVATVGFLLRLFSQHAAFQFSFVLAVLAAITMTVGNLGALQQTNMKRLLAYSSIAQMGYVLAALVAGDSYGFQAVLIYLFVYVFMNIGVFSILMPLSNSAQSDDMDIFSGLAKKSLPLSLALVFFLLSLTGIPPLAGFIGKFTIFAALINQSSTYLWLGLVMILNSVVSLYYYFRIVHVVFFVEEKEPVGLGRMPLPLFSCVVICSVITLALGLFPNPLLEWVRTVLGS